MSCILCEWNTIQPKFSLDKNLHCRHIKYFSKGCHGLYIIRTKILTGKKFFTHESRWQKTRKFSPGKISGSTILQLNFIVSLFFLLLWFLFSESIVWNTLIISNFIVSLFLLHMIINNLSDITYWCLGNCCLSVEMINSSTFLSVSVTRSEVDSLASAALSSFVNASLAIYRLHNQWNYVY